ncbi:unnamed protein product [Urochloa humidicola]
MLAGDATNICLPPPRIRSNKDLCLLHEIRGRPPYSLHVHADAATSVSRAVLFCEVLSVTGSSILGRRRDSPELSSTRRQGGTGRERLSEGEKGITMIRGLVPGPTHANEARVKITNSYLMAKSTDYR